MNPLSDKQLEQMLRKTPTGGDLDQAVEVVEDGNTLRIVHSQAEASRGSRVVNRMRGRATTGRTTDELMALLRAE